MRPSFLPIILFLFLRVSFSFLSILQRCIDLYYAEIFQDNLLPSFFFLILWGKLSQVLPITHCPENKNVDKKQIINKKREYDMITSRMEINHCIEFSPHMFELTPQQATRVSVRSRTGSYMVEGRRGYWWSAGLWSVCFLDQIWGCKGKRELADLQPLYIISNHLLSHIISLLSLSLSFCLFVSSSLRFLGLSSGFDLYGTFFGWVCSE